MTLTATPGPDQRFVGWSGDLSGSTNPLTFTITTNTTVTATFQPSPTGSCRVSKGLVSGSDPVGWLDTGAGNSLVEDDRRCSR